MIAALVAEPDLLLNSYAVWIFAGICRVGTCAYICLSNLQDFRDRALRAGRRSAS